MSKLIVQTIGYGSQTGNVSDLVASKGVKATCSFNGQGTVKILDSYNVSSLTDRGTGLYTINFTQALPNANYAFAGTGRDTDATGDVHIGQASSEVSTTTSLPFRAINGGNGLEDFPFFAVIVA